MHPESKRHSSTCLNSRPGVLSWLRKHFHFRITKLMGATLVHCGLAVHPGPGLHSSLQLKCDTEVLIRAAGLPLMQVCSRWPPSHPQYNERRLEVSLLNSEWNPFDINDRLVVITQQNLATYFPFCSIRVRENVLSYVILIIYPRNSIQQQRRHPRLKRKYLFIILFIL